jgi:serine/threonine protein phosphatase 1
MRLFAIGDIHGCLHELDSLLTEINPTPQDTLITLGDVIDRGPDSKGVIQRLIALKKKTNLIMLRGNHEQLMLDARFDEVSYISWMQNGGQEMLRSYDPNATLMEVPLEHLAFLERPPLFYHETPTHILVHGGLDPHADLSMQVKDLMLWSRFANPLPHKSGKIMVCGHTPQTTGRPANLGHAICLDTATFTNGPLTAMELNTGQIWQAFSFGNILKTHIDDYRQLR